MSCKLAQRVREGAERLDVGVDEHLVEVLSQGLDPRYSSKEVSEFYEKGEHDKRSI